MEATSYVKDLIRKALNTVVRKQKVAMLHPGRCGSTVLGSLMNQHPDIFWSGEPFEKYMQLDRSLSLPQTKKIIQKAENTEISKIYSFATKYLQDMHLSKDCINMKLPEYINLLEELGYHKFIVINRSNHLRRAISIRRGLETNLWHTTNDITLSKKIFLDTQEFQVGLNRYMPLIKYFNSLDEEEEKLLHVLADFDTLLLNYESDIEKDPKRAYIKTCEFLSLSPVKVDVKLKKTNPNSIPELIVNYDEVKKVIENTSYSWMLKEKCTRET